MGCSSSIATSPELSTNMESKRLTIDLMDALEKWKLSICDHIDAIETIHLSIAHWINDEEQDPKSIFVATFKDVSSLSTELFIGARPFSQSLNLLKGFLAEDIITRLREIYDTSKTLAKARSNLAQFRAKHPQVTPSPTSEKVDETKGNGHVANLLRLESSNVKIIEEHSELLLFDMTISLILHLNEITSQYSSMWENYQKVFKAMLQLLKSEDFIKSMKEHEERKLKKAELSKKLAVQDSKRIQIDEILSFARKIHDSWTRSVQNQAHAVFTLHRWFSSIESGLSISNIPEAGAKSLQSLKALIEDWLRITDPRFSSKGLAIPKSTLPSPSGPRTSISRGASVVARSSILARAAPVNVTPPSFETYNRLERKLKDQMSFWSQIQKRNDDVKLAVKDALDIMRAKGSQSIFHEKAQQKVTSIVEDNRKFFIGQLGDTESLVCVAYIETALKLAIDFKGISNTFGTKIEENATSAESSLVASLKNDHHATNEFLRGPTRAMSLKKFQKDRQEAMGSVPSINLHSSAEDISAASSPPGEVPNIEPNMLAPVKKTSSKRKIIDLAMQPSSPQSVTALNTRVRRSSSSPAPFLPVHSVPDQMYPSADVPKKPPPPIPVSSHSSIERHSVCVESSQPLMEADENVS